MSQQTTRPQALRIGTRSSKLASWQADWLAGELFDRGHQVRIVEITTQGDTQQQGSVASLGLQGVFTKEIQSALLAEQVDIAVHSLKDLPTQTIPGLQLAAVPPREDPSDALVSNHGQLVDLRPGSRVGTGSLRRRAQLQAVRQDLDIVGIRGNVDTRLRKLDEGEYDAIVLAAAGLSRLGLWERITELLAPPMVLPAPGQGALGLECRADDQRILDVLAPLNDADTMQATRAERSLLGTLDGGCSAPIAAWGRPEKGQLQLDGLVASLDGNTVLRASSAGPMESAASIGLQVAEALLKQGAAEVVAAAREATS